MFKLFWQKVLLVSVLVGVTGTVFAPHDHGLGKSKDHPGEGGSVSTAPEPASGLLFLTGLGLVALRLRGKKSSD